jgi:hypothetical protein
MNRKGSLSTTAMRMAGFFAVFVCLATKFLLAVGADFVSAPRTQKSTRTSAKRNTRESRRTLAEWTLYHEYGDYFCGVTYWPVAYWIPLFGSSTHPSTPSGNQPETHYTWLASLRYRDMPPRTDCIPAWHERR